MIANELNCFVYFTKFYCSTTKALVSNYNRLVRDFVSKGTVFTTIVVTYYIRVNSETLKNHSKKIFGLKTSHRIIIQEVLIQRMKNKYFKGCIMLKKLLLTMAVAGSVNCFAFGLDSLSKANDVLACTNQCDAGIIVKTLNKKFNVDTETAEKFSENGCKVACADDCFSKTLGAPIKVKTSTGTVDSKYSTETAMLACKDSMKKTFKLDK